MYRLSKAHVEISTRTTLVAECCQNIPSRDCIPYRSWYRIKVLYTGQTRRFAVQIEPVESFRLEPVTLMSKAGALLAECRPIDSGRARPYAGRTRCDRFTHPSTINVSAGHKGLFSKASRVAERTIARYSRVFLSRSPNSRSPSHLWPLSPCIRCPAHVYIRIHRVCMFGFVTSSIIVDLAGETLKAFVSRNLRRRPFWLLAVSKMANGFFSKWTQIVCLPPFRLVES